MFLSVLKDIIGLSTLHLSTISWIMRQVYRAEVSAMYTLWNLFRGESSDGVYLRLGLEGWMAN